MNGWKREDHQGKDGPKGNSPALAVARTWGGWISKKQTTTKEEKKMKDRSPHSKKKRSKGKVR